MIHKLRTIYDEENSFLLTGQFRSVKRKGTNRGGGSFAGSWLLVESMSNIRQSRLFNLSNQKEHPIKKLTNIRKTEDKKP